MGDDAEICIVGSRTQCIIALAHLQAMCGLSTDQLPKTLGSHLIRSEPTRLASCRITGTYTVSDNVPMPYQKLQDTEKR